MNDKRLADKRSAQNFEKSAATRSAIMSAARVVFERSGYEGATVAEIVKEAGTSRGSFYIHFRDKNEVFVEIFDEVRVDLIRGQMQETGRHPTVGESIHASIASYFEIYKKHALFLSIAEEVALRDEYFHQSWIALRRAQILNTEHSLRRMKERGYASIDADIPMLAIVLGAMVERVASLYFIRRFPMNDELLIPTVVMAYINGAGIDPDAPLRGYSDSDASGSSD